LKYFIGGIGGFIGSTLAHKLLKYDPLCKIVGIDNWSVGKKSFLEDIWYNPRVEILTVDASDLVDLTDSMAGCDVVFHFISNADISKAETMPEIDFWQGTYLTQNILEAMRLNKIKYLIYASGSGVYGDAGETELWEDYSPMLPTSTYGASKLAGEALISAYSHMFGIYARSYRFANVIGKNMTHSVILDFVKKLKTNSKHLEILGNGKQSKGYIHVSNVINALLSTGFQGDELYNYYNVAPDTYITVNQIADIVIKEMGLSGVEYSYSGEQSWKGDIPIVRFNTDKIKKLGWECAYTSEEAVKLAVRELLTRTNL
jgi:UDP-glucose 4-epimerase